MHHFDDQVGSEARIDLAFSGRQFDIGEAVLAVPEFRSDQFLEEWMLGSGGDWDVATVGERGHAEGVFESLLGGYIAGDDGDGSNVQFRGIQRQHQSHGVIGAGVGIDDDFPGGAGRWNYEKEEESGGKNCSENFSMSSLSY